MTMYSIALHRNPLFFEFTRFRLEDVLRTLCLYISRKKEKYSFFSQTHIFVPNIGIILKITKYRPDNLPVKDWKGYSVSRRASRKAYDY